MPGNITRAAVAVLAIGAQTSCASARPVFHRAVATYELPLDLSGVTRLVLRSSLKEGEVQVIRVPSGQAGLSGTMVYCIQGYHGTRKEAGVGPVEKVNLTFDQKREGSTLTLLSREWIYIHHSMLYTTLSLRVPDGVEVVLQPYSHEKLTGRARE